jgi:hypothetical protein
MCALDEFPLIFQLNCRSAATRLFHLQPSLQKVCLSFVSRFFVSRVFCVRLFTRAKPLQIKDGTKSAALRYFHTPEQEAASSSEAEM